MLSAASALMPKHILVHSEKKRVDAALLTIRCPPHILKMPGFYLNLLMATPTPSTTSGGIGWKKLVPAPKSGSDSDLTAF